MASLLRIGAALAVLGASLVSLASLRGTWLRELGLDLTELRQAIDDIQHERQFSDELDAHARLANARFRAKVAIARDLIEGRRTLPEAAACMRAVCDADPGNWKRVRAEEQGSTDTERLCRHAIGWVRWELADQPDRAEEVTSRLEQELHCLLAAGKLENLPRVDFRLSNF